MAQNETEHLPHTYNNNECPFMTGYSLFLFTASASSAAFAICLHSSGFVNFFAVSARSSYNNYVNLPDNGAVCLAACCRLPLK